MNYKKITSMLLLATIISSTSSYYNVKAYKLNDIQNNNQFYNNYAQNIPIDGTPLITNITNNSIFNSSIEPIIKINTISLNDSDIGENKAIHATLNGQPYNLTFISKDKNIITLKGDKICQNTARWQKNTLIVYSKGNIPNLDGSASIKVTSTSFTIDSEAPSISLSEKNGLNIQDGGHYTGKIIPVVKLNDNYGISSYDIKLNGSPYTGNVTQDPNGNITFEGNSISTDGTYTLSVSVTDYAGNSSTFSTTFTLDNTAPIISISGINNNACFNTDVTPKINIEDSDLDIDKTTLSVQKNGVLVPVDLKQNADGSLYFNVSDEGSYSFSVTAYDKSGNSSTSEPINFTIDKTAPSLDFNFTDGQYFNKAFKPIVKTNNTDDFISTLLINGNPYLFNDLPYFSDGTYEIEAQGKDKAGNLSAMYHFRFTVDTIAPIINIGNIADNFYYNTSVNPSISVTDANLSYIRMLLNGSDYTSGEITNEGSYELVILSKDKADNISEKTLRFVIDKTAPVISINGLTNDGFFNYFLNPYVFINDNNPLMSILLLDGHDYHGGLITEDGKHILLVEVVDKAGNVSKRAYKFFIKATPPEVYVSGIENGKTYNSAITPKISFSKDVIDSYTSITLDGQPYNIGDEISATGKHELTISVKDNYGNKTVKKVYFSIASSGSSTIPSKLKTIVHKIIPAKTKKSTQMLYFLTGGIWFAVICIAGIITFRFKKHKKSVE